MTRLRAVVRPFALPLRRPLATAHGPIALRRGFLVELCDEHGRRGYGEATPLPEFGTEDLSACREGIRRGLSEELAWLVSDTSDTSDTSDASDVMDENAARMAGADRMDAPCARAALESARVDLASRRRGESLARWIRRRAGLAGDPLAGVGVQALVGGEDPVAVMQSADAARAAGYRAFKLKLAVVRQQRDPGLDVERVAALREVVGSAARVRLDANEAWGFAEALVALRAFEPFGIDYVEQPVPRDDLVGLKRLAEQSPIAVAADEALLGEGLARCLATRAAEVLVAKPAALGGITASLELARRAREEGLRIVWSTLIDGAVGRALPLALAAALGPEDEVHGLGTADLLALDLVPAGCCERPDVRGRFALSSAPGLGFEPVAPARSKGAVADAGDDETLRAHLASGFEVEA